MSSYVTRQREQILAYIRANAGRHVAAEDILAHLQDIGAGVGKATVYRTLDRLVEQGVVRKYILGEGRRACYQYWDGGHCREHYHLKCERCGRLFHLECDFLSELSRHVLEHHKFVVNDAKMVLYGICEACAKEGTGQ